MQGIVTDYGRKLCQKCHARGLKNTAEDGESKCDMVAPLTWY